MVIRVPIKISVRCGRNDAHARDVLHKHSGSPTRRSHFGHDRRLDLPLPLPLLWSLPLIGRGKLALRARIMVIIVSWRSRRRIGFYLGTATEWSERFRLSRTSFNIGDLHCSLQNLLYTVAAAVVEGITRVDRVLSIHVVV